MSAQPKVASTKVVLGKKTLVRFSFLNVFKPRKNDLSGQDEYSVCVLIPKNSPELPELKAAVKAAAEAKFGSEIPKIFKNPLRDGDAERDGEEYKGMFFLNCKTQQAPGVVDAQTQPILSATEFVSGDWGRISINFYGFDQKGNRGVGAGLQNIQKVRDGEPLASTASANSDFGGLSANDDFLN